MCKRPWAKAMESNSPLLTLDNVSKAFDGVPALRGVSLTLQAGNIHGLIGHNGAGKSTLINILGGIYPADGGEVRLAGEKVIIGSPRAARALGIEIVHQDRLLAPTLTVAEALLLGDEPRFTGLPLLHRGRMRCEAQQAVFTHFGMTLDPDRLIAELSVAEQQVVQITRALRRSPRILVFDEPTAALASHEAMSLFSAIQALRRRGLAILYVSHYLNEITELCQQVTVLRDGRDVARHEVSQIHVQQLITAMVGQEQKAGVARQPQPAGETLLQLSNLSAPGRFQGVSFSARRGEIIGITGLLGSGGKSLLRALFGLENDLSGALTLNGRAFLPRSPRDAVARGIAFVPEDRRVNGIALDLSVRENIVLTILGALTRRGIIDRRRERELVKKNIDALQIRSPGIEAPVRQLSGGNQQKVVLAKWLNTGAALYLLDEPTVGVDIAAKAEIYLELARLAANGALVIIFSTDLLELQTITDRILVLARGKLVKTLDTRTADHHEILAWATGAGDQPTPAREPLPLGVSMT
jgi:ribose transport system ATP-binding protein